MAGLAVLVFMLDAFLPRLAPRTLAFGIVASLLGLLVWSFQIQPVMGAAWSGMIHADNLALYFRKLCLVGTILTLLVTANDRSILAGTAPAYYGLVLLAGCGMMLMAAAADFIMLFVALELVTVSFYILTSFLRRERSSLEAGVKYLTLGTLSSAFLLLGIGFLFAATGSTSFDVIRPPDDPSAPGSGAYLFGSMLVMAGLAFKISSFPFQMWAPDVYQGAPTPTTFFLATGSKAAGFAALVRLFVEDVFPLRDQWSILIALFAMGSLVYGAVGGIHQRDLKRLAGYLSIASAGFLTMGMAAFTTMGIGALIFYLTQDLLSLACVLLVVMAVQNEQGSCTLDALAGLPRRSPLMALALFLSLMSLAGVPPLSGAMAKFMLFGSVLQRAAIDPRYYLLVGAGLVAALVTLYVCLCVLKAAFSGGDLETHALPLSSSHRITVAICLILIVLLGLYPGPLMEVTINAVGGFAQR